MQKFSVIARSACDEAIQGRLSHWLWIASDRMAVLAMTRTER